MFWINLEDKLPTDSNILGWTPWSEEEWEEWKNKSDKLLEELEKLNNQGKIKERNELIDNNSSHWTKLKPWLEKLSYGKCWFFDAKNAASHMDIEHFRPKKEANRSKAKKRDGYWWLAFDYMNYRYAGNVPNRKKGGFFPIRRRSKIATYNNQCENEEEYYLLDPINYYDVNLIAFNEEGLAIAAPGIDKWDRLRVKVTIDRLKLNKHNLIVEERKRIWQNMNREINKCKSALVKLTKVSDTTSLKKNIGQYSKNIKLMMKDESELSSVAKWCFKLKKDSNLERLVA